MFVQELVLSTISHRSGSGETVCPPLKTLKKLFDSSPKDLLQEEMLNAEALKAEALKTESSEQQSSKDEAQIEEVQKEETDEEDATSKQSSATRQGNVVLRGRARSDAQNAKRRAEANRVSLDTKQKIEDTNDESKR